MNQPLPPVISFVSGKGGVGKTHLAANFAWVCSRSRKTLLIDMDIQNQGATGLFSGWMRTEGYGVVELMEEPGPMDLGQLNLLVVDERLSFLPATSVNKPPSFASIGRLANTPGFGERLQYTLERLAEFTACELIILDCHGGLDYVSLSAHKLGQCTLVVTEADTVTFNGTLELLNFYDEGEAPGMPAQAGGNYVGLIVNRIPPKFKYGDLSRLYKEVLSKYCHFVHFKPEMLSYVPEEDFISESVGEYPFCAELAPRSVFNRKLWLLAYKLRAVLGIEFSHPPFPKKYASDRYRKSVEMCLLSTENQNTASIVSAFTMCVFLFTLVLVFFALFIVALPTESLKTRGLPTSGEVMILLLLTVTAFSVVLLRALWRAFRYYSEKYNFKRKLWHAHERKTAAGEKATLLLLMLQRIITFVPFVLILLSITALVGYFTFGVLSASLAGATKR